MTWHKARSISSGLSPQLLVNSGLYNPPQKPQSHPHSPQGPNPQQPQHSPSHQSSTPSHPPHVQTPSLSQGSGPPNLGPQSQSQTPASPSNSRMNPDGTGYPQQGADTGYRGPNPSQGFSNPSQGPNPFHDVASMPAQPGQSYQGQQQHQAYNPGNPSVSSFTAQANPANPSLPFGTHSGSSQSSSTPRSNTQGTNGSIHIDGSASNRGEGLGYPNQPSHSMAQGQSGQASTSHSASSQPPSQGFDAGSTEPAENPSTSAARSSADPSHGASVASGSGQGVTESPERRPELPPGVTERPQLGRLSPPTRNYSFLAGGMKSEPSSHKLSALEERHATGVPVTADEAFNRALQVLHSQGVNTTQTHTTLQYCSDMHALSQYLWYSASRSFCKALPSYYRIWQYSSTRTTLCITLYRTCRCSARTLQRLAGSSRSCLT